MDSYQNIIELTAHFAEAELEALMDETSFLNTSVSKSLRRVFWDIQSFPHESFMINKRTH